MKKLINNQWRAFSKGAAIVAAVSVAGFFSLQTQATPAFARQTGAACQKCHSVSFPRLNWTGEKFMRNGFKLPSSGEALDDPMGGGDADDETIKSSNMALLKDVGKILSVRGKYEVFKKDENNSATTTGSPDFFAVFASAQLAPDVALWAEAETKVKNGETEVHNYMVNFTNLGAAGNESFFNFRVGGFTPTEWTSWSDQKRVIDSASSHPGIYRGKHHFAKVGNGLGTKTGAEVYGYNDNFLWAAGFGEATGGNWGSTAPDSNKDYWLVGRLDVLEGSSISFLYMDYGNEVTSYTLSGNYRMNRDVEFQAQFSQDDSGSITGRDDVSGFGLQGSFTLNDNWLAMARYDSTDNGYATNNEENQFTAGLVYAPWQNIKFTFAWVSELDRATTDGSDGVTEDTLTCQLQFAM